MTASRCWVTLRALNLRTLLTRTAVPLHGVVLAGALFLGCGDDDDGNAADRLGVGAQCASDDDCLQSREDGGISQTCLTQFKGGYCGLEDCLGDVDCPEASACVAHTDGMNYCFRVCNDKAQCNRNRDLENESNCSANITFVDGADGRKACVPPSSG